MDSRTLSYVCFGRDCHPVEWVSLDVNISFFTVGEQINKGGYRCRVTDGIKSTALDTQVSMEELSDCDVIPKLGYANDYAIVIFGKTLLLPLDSLVDVASLEMLQLMVCIEERQGCEVSLEQSIVVLPDRVWV